MKTKVGLILFALLAMFLQSCTEHELKQQKAEQVQFTFAVATAENSAGRAGGDELPPDAELVITLNDNSGNPVLTNQRIAIMNFGDSYITEPLEFDPGRYVIADFLVASGSEVLFVVPKKNTPLAPVVMRPLPYSFNVLKGKITNVEMEVVSTTGYIPEDFGYVSFGIGVVNPLSIAVFTSKAGQAGFATAEAFLYDNEDNLLDTFDLEAKVNLISFKGSADASYKLIVRKSGYAPYIKTFNYSDLVGNPDQLPLKILLSPAFTIRTDLVGDFEMTVQGSGSITIDWGDGFVETSSLETSDPVQHTYAVQGMYDITITGDIAGIDNFYSFYQQGRTTEINFEHLTGLGALTLDVPAVLDLSHNVNLVSVNIMGISEFEQLLLPPTHKINFIIVDGGNSLDTAEIDYIVNNIYTNAVAFGIREGTFRLNENWSEATPPFAYPSPAALAQLAELRDYYGWDVSDFQ